MNTITNNDPSIINAVQQNRLVRDLIEPVESELAIRCNIDLRLKTIRELANDRRVTVHDSIKSDLDQRSLLVECNTFAFPEEYEYKEKIIQLINTLNEIKLKRCKEKSSSH